MKDLKTFEAWFVTGSQHLYGEETLKKVAEHSQKIVEELNKSKAIPVKVVYKPVLTTPDSISNLCTEANSSKNCIGLITWMHTFSPAKMWIRGLKELQKPFVHLHTQFNRDIPWSEIDMDFMNLISRPMVIESLDTFVQGWERIEKLLLVIGRMKTFKTNLVFGCV